MLKKIFILTVVLLASQVVMSQSWEDSLELGKKLCKEGKYQRAYSTLKEAQKIAPNEVDLSQDIGNAAYRSKDYEMAEKAFKSAASNDELLNRQAYAWHNVGNSQMQSKDYQGAIESYKNALRKNPSNDKTRYNLAEAKRRLKKQEKKQKQNKNQEQNKNQQQKQNDQQKNGQQGENKKNPSDKNQNKQQQQNQQKNGSQQEAEKRKAKLSDKKTDRMLDKLLKKESKTKRKVRGFNSKKGDEEVKSGKKW